jgi:hypothetical protein
MSILERVLNKKKMDNKLDTAINASNTMFPTPEHAHAAIRMQNALDKGQLPPSQYRWNEDVLPWRMSRPHWTDMMSTQEGLTDEEVAQLNSDYYKMNYLPDVLNTPKNIDLLIKAAEKDKFNKY